MIQELPSTPDHLIAVRIEGKISESDIDRLHHRMHEVIDQGQKVDWYMEIDDFEGYELSGLWEDLKVTAKHYQDFGNIAIVGDQQWQQWAAKTADHFTSSEVRYYDKKDQQNALNWMTA